MTYCKIKKKYVLRHCGFCFKYRKKRKVSHPNVNFKNYKGMVKLHRKLKDRLI